VSSVSGATRLLPMDGGAEEFRGDPTVRPRAKIWAREQDESSDKDGAPERLRCVTILTAGAAKGILLYYSASRGQTKVVTAAAKSEQFTGARCKRASSCDETERIWQRDYCKKKFVSMKRSVCAFIS